MAHSKGLLSSVGGTMPEFEKIRSMVEAGRKIEIAAEGDSDLGPLSLLPGRWENDPDSPIRGWNMIALPFAAPPPSRLNYRLLLNKYRESLTFENVIKPIPNRGIETTPAGARQDDQFLAGLDYLQVVHQESAQDFPQSEVAGGADDAIHHEPGLWLSILNNRTDGLDIARLATVPHGDSLLALGRHSTLAGAPRVPDVSGLPVGVAPDLNSPYLAPYAHFHKTPFEGVFDPVFPARLLSAANAGLKIARTTALDVDTTAATGGVLNIPFVVRQANAASMKSTFWIQELEERDEAGSPKLRLQYLQVVMLDFFPRRDGMPGPIRWPHVSINTLLKVR